ncbi:MAG: tRNA pseudouridine(55) synthase TruB [Bacteroidia bacterium]|nr:MAG: tRNA pseudouridine(55) synthase TruB [Bacteroidia bacterium]
MENSSGLTSYSPGKDLREGHIFLVNKPLGWTSFNVVGKVKYLLRHHLGYRKIKVGHAGTLDPLATGLMVVCVGRATKLAQGLTAADKEYYATFTLGASTPSYDGETAVDTTHPTEHITEELVRQVARGMVGEMLQVPPLFSAKRVDGQRAYDLARRGQEAELAPVPIVIHEFELLSIRGLQVEARIRCSKGTYIRAIARDFGQALRSGAYLTALRRSRSGDFTLEGASTVAELEAFITAIAPLYATKKQQDQ